MNPNICIAMLAHVDAGKTTLSECILSLSGVIRKMGRVDHKDTFLDTHELERKRGITIFSKQALFSLGDQRFTLLDTPGHVDFNYEVSRSLAACDGATGAGLCCPDHKRRRRRAGTYADFMETSETLPGSCFSFCQ